MLPVNYSGTSRPMLSRFLQHLHCSFLWLGGWVAGFLFNILVEMSQVLRNGFPILSFYQYNWNGSWEHGPSKLTLAQGQPMGYVTAAFFLFPQHRDIWGHSLYQLSFFVYTILSHGFFNFFLSQSFSTSALLTFGAGCFLCWGHSVHYGKLSSTGSDSATRLLVTLVLIHDNRCPCRLQLGTNVLN